MADGSGLRSVADALGEVAQWRAEEEARHSAELAEVDQEVASLQTGIENLKQQLEALGRFRTELLGKASEIDQSQSAKTYEAVFGVLAEQREHLTQRADALLVAEQERDAKLAETLDDPAIKNLLAEYQAFVENVQPTLASIPPTYRAVIEETSRKQREELESRLGGLGTEPIGTDEPALAVDVLLAVDAPEGDAEVLMVVMPVADGVHNAWQDRPEDLQTRLAARVMQAVFSTTKALGLPGNQGVFGGHREQLAVEIELVGGQSAPVAERFRSAVQDALSSAPELQAGKVHATARVVDVDSLLPPEEGPTDEEVA